MALTGGLRASGVLPGLKAEPLLFMFLGLYCKRQLVCSEIPLSNSANSGMDALGTWRVKPIAQMAAREYLLFALRGMAKATIPSMYSSVS
jgi:hypothetical protein